MLYPDIHKLSDHVPLTIEVGITETNINLSFRSISKDSEEEKNFIMSLINGFSYIFIDYYNQRGVRRSSPTNGQHFQKVLEQLCKTKIHHKVFKRVIEPRLYHRS